MKTSSTLVRDFVRTFIPTVKGFNSYTEPVEHTAAILNAARARGLHITDVGLGKYFYKDGVLVGGVRQMLTSLVSSVAVSACKSKPVSRQLFAAAGIPVPDGLNLAASDLAAAMDHLAAGRGPLVVKPGDGEGGNGITCGITTAQELQEAWTCALSGRRPNASIIVEEQIVGLDIRAYVVGDRVAAAATRLPAYVVGDGRSSLEDLVEEKMAMRRRNAYLGAKPIVVDKSYLERVGLTLSTVVADGDVVLLNEKANLHQGGENIDVTESTCPALKSLAIRAARAIPGLGAAGVDIMASSLDSDEGAVVLEANTHANILVHHLPAYGNPVDVGSALVDEMIRRASC